MSSGSYLEQNFTVFSEVEGLKTSLQQALISSGFKSSATIERTISLPEDFGEVVPATVVTMSSPSGESLASGVATLKELAGAYRYGYKISEIRITAGEYLHSGIRISSTRKVPPSYLRSSSSTELPPAGFTASATSLVHKSFMSSPHSVRSTISARISEESATSVRCYFVYGDEAAAVRISYSMTPEEVSIEVASHFTLPAAITRLEDRDGVAHKKANTFEENDIIGIQTAAGNMVHTHKK